MPRKPRRYTNPSPPAGTILILPAASIGATGNATIPSPTNMKMQTHPVTSTCSLLALGLGCALSALPLNATFAQNSTPGIPTSAGEVDTTKQDPLNTGSTVPKPAVPAAKTGEKLTSKEKKFLNKAGQGNSAEVTMAELALKNGESQGVKDFAEKMVTDHKEANATLAEISESHGLGKFEPMLTSEDKALYANMTALKGTAFDTAYVKHAVVDHEQDLKEYKMAEGEVKDPALLAYTEKTEKIVAEHLSMAKELQSKSATGNH